ncbi:MAG: FKBP-type peptidyl-prolyl cis-trans isomerase [Spirochaetota bacterium]
MKRIIILIPVLAIIMLTGCDRKEKEKESGKAEDTMSSSETMNVFYAIGMYESRRIQQLQPTESELEEIFKGIKESIHGKARLDEKEFQTQMKKVSRIINERIKVKAAAEKEKGEQYIRKFAKEEGVLTTKSGLAYMIIDQGEGEKPQATDKVKVHYEGRLIDGTVFDSSKKRGEPAELALNRVIKGWSEGIQMVNEGGKIQLVIPSDLAYGDRGGRDIPGGATLIFDVELLEIVSNGDTEAE